LLSFRAVTVPDSWQDYVKICGITSTNDAVMVADAGASALGVIFAESPRRVTVAHASAILEATRGRLVRVAVFGHDEDSFILERLDALDVEAVQLHGHLGEQLLSELRQRPVRIVKALSIESEEFDSFDDTSVDAVMIDGAAPGSGQTHSWERLASRTFRVPLIAAGGLNPSNVRDVITLTAPSGVDCASGVESTPGVKDRQLVEKFVAHAHQAFLTVEAP
jgi:phosphoribosylanthranilate isomerase